MPSLNQVPYFRLLNNSTFVYNRDTERLREKLCLQRSFKGFKNLRHHLFCRNINDFSGVFLVFSRVLSIFIKNWKTVKSSGSSTVCKILNKYGKKYFKVRHHYHFAQMQVADSYD